MLSGFLKQVPLAPQTTFQIGGPAEYYAAVQSEAELKDRLQEAAQHEQPVTILGGGSNVLVSDAGVAGCVISPAIQAWSVVEAGDNVLLTVGAGDVFDEVVAKTVAAGWWGLENLSHIPGSVGATPIQNVGAYGVEIADLVETVQAVHRGSGESRTFTNSECGFGYRDSWFKSAAGQKWVVTYVTYRLRTVAYPQLSYRDLQTRFGDTTPSVADVRAAVIAIRAAKFPNWQETGTAGSFFKNPIVARTQYEVLRARYPELPHYVVDAEHVKLPLGWILDHICHLRGVYDGPVGSFAAQALVVVNTGGATSAEVTQFAEGVAEQVRAATDITIEWEVTPLA